MKERERAAPRRHFNYSNVMSTLAVFIALSGTAVATHGGAPFVDSADIVDGQVTTDDLGGNTVRSADIADGRIFNVDVADGVFTGSKIKDESLTKDDVLNNSLNGVDIEDGTLGSADVADGNLTGADVANNSLTGDDTNESTLGIVPQATLGGLGRSGTAGSIIPETNSCDPESQTLIVCTSVNLTLPAQTRVLIIGQIFAQQESGSDFGAGSCELGTSVVDLPSTSTHVELGSFIADNVTMVGVTPPIGPGTVSFRIRCNEFTFGEQTIRYGESEIAAVALSPS